MDDKKEPKPLKNVTAKKPSAGAVIEGCDELYKVFDIRVRGARKKPLVDTPSTLNRLAYEYFSWCDANPIRGKEYVKSGNAAGSEYEITRRRLKSVRGFCLYLGRGEDWLRDTEKMWNKMLDDSGGDERPLAMVRAFAAVRQLLEDDCDTGTLAGFFEPSYMAKVRGLKEAKDVTSAGASLQPNLSINVLTPEAIDKINKLSDL